MHIAKPREHAQRQNEIHPRPLGQQPQAALHRPGLRQDIIDQLERQVLSQLTQMARSEDAPGDGNGLVIVAVAD